MTTRMRSGWAAEALFVLLFGLTFVQPAAALDYVTIRDGEKQRELAGRIEVEAVDGGVMLLARDGALWPIEKENLVSRRSDAKSFAPFTPEEVARQLGSELPGFKAHQTQHYLIY